MRKHWIYWKASETHDSVQLWLFTDGSAPQDHFTEGPFVKFADKSTGNEDILSVKWKSL